MLLGWRGGGAVTGVNLTFPFGTFCFLFCLGPSLHEHRARAARATLGLFSNGSRLRRRLGCQVLMVSRNGVGLAI